MKRVLAVVLCAAMPMLALAEDSGYKVMYDGGSVPGVKAGTGVKLYIEANQIRFVKDKKDIAVVPASAVTEISYGQDVHRRVGTAVAVGVFTLGLGALTALSKSKKHFVGLTWANGDQKGGLAVSAGIKWRHSGRFWCRR
jgi:hypothetical protein